MSLLGTSITFFYKKVTVFLKFSDFLTFLDIFLPIFFKFSDFFIKKDNYITIAIMLLEPLFTTLVSVVCNLCLMLSGINESFPLIPS